MCNDNDGNGMDWKLVTVQMFDNVIKLEASKSVSVAIEQAELVVSRASVANLELCSQRSAYS